MLWDEEAGFEVDMSLKKWVGPLIHIGDVD